MRRVDLTETDIDLIERVVATEVPERVARRDPRAYQDMVGAVADTITNRLATGRYGSTVSKVANARNQFSAINGPKRAGQKAPYGSVERAPQAGDRVKAAVSSHLGARAQGQPSKIGGATDFANPNVSDRRNVVGGWVGGMIDRGAVPLGVGTDVHYHGLSPTSRPAPEYSIGLPKEYARQTIGPYDGRAKTYPGSLEYASAGLLSGRVPTPTTAPRGMFSSSPAERGSRVASAPANVPTPTARPSMTSALPADFNQQRFGGNVIQNPMPRDQKDRLAQTYGVPGSRVAPQSVGLGRQGLTKTQEANLADRLGKFDTVQPSMAQVAARSVPAPTARPTSAMTAAQEKNLSDRLGTFAETRQVQPSAAERITRTALGMFSTPAAAATRTPTTTAAPASRPAAPAPAAAPARTNFAGPAGSPRSVDGRLNAELRSVNPMVSQAPRPATVTPTARPAASLLGVTPAAAATPARPTTNFAGPIGSPRAVEGRQINAARQTAFGSVPMPTAAPRAGLFSSVPVPSAAPRAPVQSRPVATPVAAPRVAMPTPAPTVSVAPPARRAVAPQAVAQVARTVAPAPAAPTPTARPEPQQPSPVAGRVGTIGGSLIGGAIAGPVGSLIGGYLGNKVATSGAFSGGLGGGMFSGGSMNGMGANSVGMNGGGNQGSSLNGAGLGGGYRDSTGSFAGFGERDSAVGPNGGKVGGSSKSSSSGGKSSGGSSGGKK